MMENVIIIAILVLVVAVALLRARKHFKGGCCGSGSNALRTKKTLTEPVLGQKTLTVEGMHCENCEIRVENALNRLDGALCKVNLRKKTATVSYSREIPDSLLKETVEKLGYEVTSIH